MTSLNFLLRDPAHWRGRAREARALAQEIPDANGFKQKMFDVAADYDELARIAEERKQRDREGITK